ncbi:hypothetical protein F0U62_36915 [Cystobacter fuscus]|uniref:hypothetical protein n=1 Tax=Cystobacter fuscus TaxID=43 RepID=UPI002B2E6627|nr:hypothetical protein F0U62_36915 [Cystobacter fuscus]
MTNILQGFADLICHGDAILNPKKWLAEEVSHEALNIPNLDEFSPQAILPLAVLVAKGECDAARLARATNIDKSKVDGYLEALCEFKFAEETGNGYKSTQAGEKAFEAIGKRMVERERFEVKRRLQQLEALRQHSNDRQTPKT